MPTSKNDTICSIETFFKKIHFICPLVGSKKYIYNRVCLKRFIKLNLETFFKKVNF